MHVSEQEIFQRFFAEYAATHQLGAQQLRAARCISGCGTRAMGAHVLGCPSGACEQLQFHACRHRSCPRCAEAARCEWIDATLERLLPCPHFHVVCTLPHELIPVWACNRAAFAELFMRCVRESLLQLLARPRVLGATPGLLLSLHTWGRTLSHHPHVHCLLSAGGIDAQGLWRACRPGWLLPVAALQHLLRGKLLAGVRQGLQQHWVVPERANLAAWLTNVGRLYRHHWNIEIRAPYEHGRGVVLYLARYAKGGPLPLQRPLQLDGSSVLMPYRDHRDGQTKTLRLHVQEFISRLLWHVPPRGLHTIRHAGLYSSALRGQHHLASQLLNVAATDRPWPRTPSPSRADPPPPACPHCGLPMLRLRCLPAARLHAWPMHHLGEIPPRPPAPPPWPLARGPTGRSNGQPTAKTPRPQPPPYHLVAAGGGP